MKQTSTTLETTISQIGVTLEELIKKVKDNTANRTDLVNMKILTDSVEHLKFFNKELFNQTEVEGEQEIIYHTRIVTKRARLNKQSGFLAMCETFSELSHEKTTSIALGATEQKAIEYLIADISNNGKEKVVEWREEQTEDKISRDEM